MLLLKRVLATTSLGLVAGFVGMTLASSYPIATEQLSTSNLATLVLSRMIMGFMIGVSALPIKWWKHGFMMGLLGSIPIALPVLDRPLVVVISLVFGMAYGFLIELATTVGLRLPSIAAPEIREHAMA